MMRLAHADALKARAYGPPSPAEIDSAVRRRLKVEGGKITEWRGGDNRWHPAGEQYRQPLGKRPKSDSELREDAGRYLALPAAYALNTGQNAQRAPYRPANDNGALLHNLRISGAYTFAQAWVNAGLYPACRVPMFMVGIARGCTFMGGRTRRNATAAEGSFVGPACGPEDAWIAAIDGPRIAAELGEHAEVLQQSLSGTTARELGGGTKAGERRAVKAQDAALAALARLAS
jgi:hypothetical protein